MRNKKNGGNTGKKTPTGDYTVGYCRPPKQHQFPKGVSGNPEGGRRRTRTSEDVFGELFRRRTTITTPNGEQRVPFIEALGLAAFKEALGGSVPMIKMLFDMNDRVAAVQTSGVRFSDGDLALLEDYGRRFAADRRVEDDDLSDDDDGVDSDGNDGGTGDKASGA